MKLTIDGVVAEVGEGATVLDAAQSVGVKVPTMCHLAGHVHYTSCMICVVKERKSTRLLPSCSAPAEEGMVIETDSEEVLHARRNALDLLLSEHVGDCEAPCRLGCPAHVNVPLMIRQIMAGQDRMAIETVKDDLALPAVLGRICPAPCEKACRRSRFDAPLAICRLKRFAADIDLSGNTVYTPACKPRSGKRVAIVGAGPAGLSAAYHLARDGHSCTILDDRDEPGGQLRAGVPERVLPREILAKEIDVIRRLGVEFKMNTRVGRDVDIGRLKDDFDAVVLAPGQLEAEEARTWGVDVAENVLLADVHILQTSDAKVFAGGSAVQRGHLAVRAMAHGKIIASSVGRYLQGLAVTAQGRRFDSRMGKLLEGEILEFMKEVDPAARVAQAGDLSAEEAVKECRRCMHCDCRKADTCRLRDFSDACGATQKRFNIEGRKRFERITTHRSVVYEPGKCIKCGICVRISERAHEKLGLAFIGRGFDAYVGVPFNETLGDGLKTTAADCVGQCPTGALAFKED